MEKNSKPQSVHSLCFAASYGSIQKSISGLDTEQRTLVCGIRTISTVKVSYCRGRGCHVGLQQRRKCIIRSYGDKVALKKNNPQHSVKLLTP